MPLHDIKRIDKYARDDADRAKAVMETVGRYLSPHVVGNEGHGWWSYDDLRDTLAALEPWLMDVFRAVRGEPL